MKARRFSDQLKDAGVMLAATKAPEPSVVMRAGPDGEEVAVRHVKVRHDHVRKKSYIILEVGPHYPTEDAYLRACRAGHWRTAQLRHHGIEPIQIPADASHYPPDDFDWSAAEKF